MRRTRNRRCLVRSGFWSREVVMVWESDPVKLNGCATCHLESGLDCDISCGNSGTGIAPGTSVEAEGAVVSTAPLIVVAIRGRRAHIKDGVQMACRHNLIFAYFWRTL